MFVILDHVLERRDLARTIEGEAHVRYRVEEDATRTQLAEVVVDRPDGIFAVLQEVIGDDEVLRCIGKGREHLTVVDDVGLDEVPLGKLRVVVAQIATVRRST